MNFYLYYPEKAMISNTILALAKSRSLFLSREASPVQDPLPEQRDRPVYSGTLFRSREKGQPSPGPSA